MSKLQDLTGQKFGRLTVIERDLSPHKDSHAYWKCKCNCGNENFIVVSSDRLRRGVTKSCGCLQKEIASKRYKRYNSYDFTVDTCIGYTEEGKRFLVDIDKYDLIKDYYWGIETDSGYVVTNIGNKIIRLHRLVTNCPKGKVVDHKHGSESRFDNRLCNLRICDVVDNARNSITHKNNKLGVKGVSIDRRKYVARIRDNGKTITIGRYETVKEAADAYDKKAKELFGEFAWLNNYQEPVITIQN